MRVYDFDGTIYNGDSTYDFYKYLVIRHPKVIVYLPKFICSYILFKLNLPVVNDKKLKSLKNDDYKIQNKTYLKQYFFKFLNVINKDDIDNLVYNFWIEKIKKNKIFKYYLNQRRKDDVIISASPRFLLEPVSKLFGCDLICSEVNKHTGIYSGLTCWWKEKVIRFRKVYKNKIIHEFYSDSYIDLPLALISKRAYMVLKNGEVIDWSFK